MPVMKSTSLAALASAVVFASAALASAGWIAGCKPKPEKPQIGQSAANIVQASAPEAQLTGNAERGRALVQKFECLRCHTTALQEPPTSLNLLGLLAPATEKACVGCHEKIIDRTFAAPAEALKKWDPLVKDLRFAPSLEQMARFRPSWLVSFLQKPHDLRPALRMKMPRLAINEADARDIATFLASNDKLPSAGSTAVAASHITKGNAEQGQKLLAAKGCMFCHRLSGGPTIAVQSPAMNLSPEKLERALALAPDLRHARARLSPAVLAAWIQTPSALKPTTEMPDIPMTVDEARDIATFLYTTPLAPLPKNDFQRLPVLARPVKFDEVNAKVFHRTCWHCHSEPDFAIGDGGPGNSGGFGFAPKGIDLSSYQGVMSGFLDRSVNAANPPRKSLFLPSPAPGGEPRLLAALLARHREEGDGADTGPVRGMPLGLPPLSAEDIQLVETWIAQGRPR